MTTSTRSTSDCGIVLMSTTPLAVEPTDRRPSISTSVRTVPRLRRLSALMPAMPLLSSRREFDGRMDAASAGSWLTKSAMLLVGEVFWISSCVSTITGVGASKPSRVTREPVTTICSTGAASTLSGAAVASCANAGALWTSAMAVMATPRRPLRPSGRRICSKLRISAVPFLPRAEPHAARGVPRRGAGLAALFVPPDHLADAWPAFLYFVMFVIRSGHRRSRSAQTADFVTTRLQGGCGGSTAWPLTWRYGHIARRYGVAE